MGGDVRGPASTAPNEDLGAQIVMLLKEGNHTMPVRKQAGKLVKKGELVKALALLEANKRDERPPSWQPPTKNNIIGMSRPVQEWPWAIANANVQRVVYALSEAEREALKACEPISSKDKILRFVEWFGVDTAGFCTSKNANVQAMNAIIGRALATYDGVKVKADNRHKKQVAKAAAMKLEPPELESVYAEGGRLRQPPGVNHTLLATQQCKLRLDPSSSSVAHTFLSRTERLNIPQGAPGHVPEWQRPNLSGSKGKRMRLPKSLRHEGPIPMAILSAGEDWVRIDLRGALRDAIRRGLLPRKSASIAGLLALFTGDPVIDPARRQVRMAYKAGTVPYNARPELHRALSGAKRIAQLIERGDAAMVTIDLGVTHPMAFAVYRLAPVGKECLGRGALPDNILAALRAHTDASTRLEAALYDEAVGALPPEMRTAIAEYNACKVEETIARICTGHGIAKDAVPWGEITSGTFHIRDAVIAAGGAPSADWRDHRYVHASKPRLPKDVNDALNAALWAAKRTSPEYARLATRKAETARWALNWVLAHARRLTRARKIVLACEALNVHRMFDGQGKGGVGIVGLLARKGEGRWYIRAFHKAIEEHAVKSAIVVQVNPQYTSQTCPECGHCEKGNRNGEDFKCLKCGVSRHADIEVATENIARVALSGNKLPGPVERGNGSPNLGGARNTLSPKNAGSRSMRSKKPRRPTDSLEPALEDDQRLPLKRGQTAQVSA